ncbi:MAG: hypothetical protein AAGI52_05845 [Bacteroidota bacterium]
MVYYTKIIREMYRFYGLFGGVNQSSADFEKSVSLGAGVSAIVGRKAAKRLKADQLYMDGVHYEAARSYYEIIAGGSADEEIVVKLGDCLWAASMSLEAAEVYASVEDLFGLDVEKIQRIVIGYLRAGKAVESIGVLKGILSRLVDLEIDDMWVYYYLGLAYEQAEEWSECVRYMSVCIENGEDDVGACASVAYALQRLGNHDTAAHLLEECLRIEPEYRYAFTVLKKRYKYV